MNTNEYQVAMDKVKHIIDNQVPYAPLSTQGFEFIKYLFNHHPTIKRSAKIESICRSEKMDKNDKYFGEMWFKIKFFDETRCEFINGYECVENLFNGEQTQLI